MTAATAPIIAYDPPPPFDGMRVSEEDYWAYYSEEREPTWEWNDGVLEEKGVSDHLTFKVFDWFVQLLIDYLREHPGTERVGLEMAFRLAMPRKTTIRRPDYALIMSDNPRPIGGLDRSYRGIYDLCIEGLSDSDRETRDNDLIVKRAEYAAVGVREFYVLHREARYRAFWRLNPRGVYEPLPVSAEGVVASELLPGFRWRLADLDRQPDLETLLDDPVYQGYVRKALQAARAQAEAERERAEYERERADRLAARLRALGIEPD